MTLMSTDEFLKLSLSEQARLLGRLAPWALTVIPTDDPSRPALEDAIRRVDAHLAHGGPANDVGVCFQRPDDEEELDLAHAEEVLGPGDAGFAAFDIILYATATVARAAFEHERNRAMPEPVRLWTPELAASAVAPTRNSMNAVLFPTRRAAGTRLRNRCQKPMKHPRGSRVHSGDKPSVSVRGLSPFWPR